MASIKTTDGAEYILRADLNSIGELQEHYGTVVGGMKRLSDTAEMLRIAAILINEELYARGSAERVTPAGLGARLTGRDMAPLSEAVLEALQESFGVDRLKKKKPMVARRMRKFRSRDIEI